MLKNSKTDTIISIFYRYTLYGRRNRGDNCPLSRIRNFDQVNIIPIALHVGNPIFHSPNARRNQAASLISLSISTDTANLQGCHSHTPESNLFYQLVWYYWYPMTTLIFTIFISRPFAFTLISCASSSLALRIRLLLWVFVCSGLCFAQACLSSEVSLLTPRWRQYILSKYRAVRSHCQIIAHSFLSVITHLPHKAYASISPW